MPKLDYCEFYITNVCNLNCPRCNRYNNYAFTGHYKWKDHAEIYQQWAKRLDVGRIGILGGEPMLNPEFDIWVEEVAKLWPQASILIITNGMHFHRWPGLYQLLEKYKGRIRIDINRHNTSAEVELFRDVEEFFPNGYKKFYIDQKYYTQSPDHLQQFDFVSNNIGREIWEDQTYKIAWRDNNNIFVRYGDATAFTNIAVENYNGRAKLSYWSDPEIAASVCGSKWSHHFLNGKLYKCNVSAILPNFTKQFDVEMTDQQRSIVESYQPAEISWGNHDLSKFIDELQRGCYIEQCRLCPQVLNAENFQSNIKKIHIKKN